MPKKAGYIKEKTWAEYGLTEREYQDTRKLRAAVRKAAKAANQRMLRLERAGKTAGVYKLAQRNLDRLGRRRFKEHPEKMTVNQLRHEYAILRDFLSTQTSTVQGSKQADDKRYEKAKQRGFTGSQAEWNQLVLKYYTGKVEELFSSNIIYKSITGGDEDVIDQVLKTKPKTEGQALATYLSKIRRKQRTRQISERVRRLRKRATV